MAVETKFVVVRKGEEKMTFANKKEADAYDKMLDMAEAFTDWLLQHQPALDESQAETLGLLIAEQKMRFSIFCAPANCRKRQQHPSLSQKLSQTIARMSRRKSLLQRKYAPLKPRNLNSAGSEPSGVAVSE